MSKKISPSFALYSACHKVNVGVNAGGKRVPQAAVRQALHRVFHLSVAQIADLLELADGTVSNAIYNVGVLCWEVRSDTEKSGATICAFWCLLASKKHRNKAAPWTRMIGDAMGDEGFNQMAELLGLSAHERLELRLTPPPPKQLEIQL